MILVRSWREPSPRPGRSYRRSPGRTSTRCTQGFFWVISKYKWYHIYNTGTWSVANKPKIEKFYLFYSNLNHMILWFFMFYSYALYFFYVHVKKKMAIERLHFHSILYETYIIIFCQRYQKLKCAPLIKRIKYTRKIYQKYLLHLKSWKSIQCHLNCKVKSLSNINKCICLCFVFYLVFNTIFSPLCSVL